MSAKNRKQLRYPARPKRRTGRRAVGLNPPPSRWAAARKPWVLVSAVVIAVVISAVSVALVTRAKTSVVADAKPLSRYVLEVAEEQVRLSKPTPTLAALQYAYVSSVYSDALQSSGQQGAVYAAEKMLILLYPQSEVALKTKLAELAARHKIKPFKSEKDLPAGVTQTLAYFTARYAGDNHDLVWDGVVPTGPGKWVNRTGEPPFSPRAGEWKRWNVTKPIEVPPPPKIGSPEDSTQLLLVRQASATRSGEDVNSINFWGGVPGTDSPGGIWLNQLYKRVSISLPAKPLEADMKFAYIQKMTAQAISDAFIECWKVKFTHWTARPDMRDPSIKTSMPNPNFPGYISGHSTISKAAADVLSVLVPDETSQWQTWAIEARNSRLVAGIHFDVDNTVGFDVGAEVARQTVASQLLKQEL